MRSVLVTGCSSGFGLETAVMLGTRGWQVFASMRDLDRRSDLDAALRDAGLDDRRFEVLQLDVTDHDSIANAADCVLEATGGSLDAVVHNAGIALGGFFEEVTDEQFRAVVETNFFGVLDLTREVLPAMRVQRKGRLVLVSSNSAFSGTPAFSAYAASKWALEGWAESLAMEMAPFGVDVVLVEPGSYRTAIWDRSERVIPDDGPYVEYAEAMTARAEDMVERRARDPREVAEAIAGTLEARKPRFRNPVGPDAKALHAARGVVPFGLRSRLLRRYVGAPKQAP